MKKVVITGATGSIGVALIKKLISQGIEVLVLSRMSSNTDNIPASDLVKIEYCSLEEMSTYKPSSSDYDVFYHLAWNGTYGESRNDELVQLKNADYTVDAVRLASRFGCSAFVGVGSQSENGIIEKGQKVRYDSPENPTNWYGKAKLRACKMSQLECQKLDIRHSWTRILSAYGEGDKPYTMVMSSIIKFLNGEDVNFTLAMQDWDYIYNGDVANALYLIGLKGRNNSIYPIGSGKTRKLREYIEIIRDTANKDAKCNFGAIPYYDKQVMYLCADIDNLKNDTGFEPKVSFEEGIKNTVEWYKEKYCR